MKTRKLGKNGPHVSEVGLGAWQLGGDAWGSLDHARADSILASALDSGITFIDTADVYGGGESERRIAGFLKARDESVFVATKVGRGSQAADRYEYAGLKRDIEAGRERLEVDCLDLVQLHCIPTAVMREGAVFKHLRRLREEGLIQRFGASVESMEEALICSREEGLASLQIIFNLFRQKPVDLLFETTQERDIAIIVRLPLASGLLSGKMTAETTFESNDHRSFNEDGQAFNVGETFAGLGLRKGVELSERLRPLVPAGMTMAQMALRWILDHEAVTTIIPGASRPEQAAANAAVSDLPPLAPELHQRLREFYRSEGIEAAIRGPY